MSRKKRSPEDLKADKDALKGFTIVMRPAFKEQLEKRAHEEGMTLSGFMREVLHNYLEGVKPVATGAKPAGV